MELRDIIRLKHRQHKQDVARIRQLERDLALMTEDRDDWRDIVRAGAEMRELVSSVAQKFSRPSEYV